jgi:Flp pilus assembly pilin Flp
MYALKVLLHNDDAQGLVEYALLIMLVAITAFAALQLLGKKASNSLSNTANSMP